MRGNAPPAAPTKKSPSNPNQQLPPSSSNTLATQADVRLLKEDFNKLTPLEE